MKEAFNEVLFKFLQKKLEQALKDANKYGAPDECDDIIEALDLCEKLLTYDYFEKSEKVIDNFDDNYRRVISSWGSQYNKNLREKKKDMKRLFALIADNCEEWC